MLIAFISKLEWQNLEICCTAPIRPLNDIPLLGKHIKQINTFQVIRCQVWERQTMTVCPLWHRHLTAQHFVGWIRKNRLIVIKISHYSITFVVVWILLTSAWYHMLRWSSCLCSRLIYFHSTPTVVALCFTSLSVRVRCITHQWNMTPYLV